MGNYKIKNTMMDTHGHLLTKGTVVHARKTMPPSAKILGVDVYGLKTSGGKLVIVSMDDIEEV